MLTTDVHDGICLTRQERSLVRLVAEGHTNRGVAEILDTHMQGVENRRTAIMRKVKLSSPASLVRDAVRSGLVEA